MSEEKFVYYIDILSQVACLIERRRTIKSGTHKNAFLFATRRVWSDKSIGLLGKMYFQAHDIFMVLPDAVFVCSRLRSDPSSLAEL